MSLHIWKHTLRVSRKPLSSTSSALMSCSLATQTAAVLRTYGSSSCRRGRLRLFWHMLLQKHLSVSSRSGKRMQFQCQTTFRHLCKGSQRYSVILSTLMQPIVRTAKALIKGFGSCVSYSKRLHEFDCIVTITHKAVIISSQRQETSLEILMHNSS